MACTEATTTSAPDFLAETTFPKLSSTLTETSAKASDPPVIDSSLYSLTFILATSTAIFWIALRAESTGPTPISDAIYSLP